MMNDMEECIQSFDAASTLEGRERIDNTVIPPLDKRRYSITFKSLGESKT